MKLSLHVEDKSCAFKYFASNIKLLIWLIQVYLILFQIYSLDEVLDNLLFCNLFLFYLIFHTSLNHHNTMSCGFDEVAAAVEARSPVIVDVRTEDEFASGRIPGAKNIPLSEVI